MCMEVVNVHGRARRSESSLDGVRDGNPGLENGMRGVSIRID
jgi:hypothetical protein